MAREFTFGAGPERLKRLLFEGLEEPERQEDVTKSQSDHTTKPGDEWIGRYRLLRTIGEGGMGIVYLAEQQEPIRRKVALKVIKPGMDSKRVVARFEAERQALALLDHPNIAHVYDAGTTESGRPYFVMEYVKGQSITDHCDRHKLTIKERLRLFQLVCQAVQHAHQKGIIHRDIKPSNILVSLQDEKAVPKIIDFGVAKALSQPLTEQTLATEDSQLLGTPEYMSPEQADMVTEDIDTRSDIYSLGVLLYVLLTGVLPFDSDTLREGGIENIRKTIRDTDPKTPSTRLNKLGEEALAIAQNRRMEIHTLARHLKKELEWIPLKAMRKERSERYRSASELADDIENYLNGVPLIAGPPGTGYKLKKFVRRNAVLSSAVLAIALALLLGMVATTAMYLRAERQARISEAVSSFLRNDLILSVSPTRTMGREVTVRSFLDTVSENLEAKFKDEPLVEASIRDTLGYTYRILDDYGKAEAHLKRAILLHQEHLGSEDPKTLKSMSGLVWVYLGQGRFVEAEKLAAKALRIGRRLFNEEHEEVLRHTNDLAFVYIKLGRYEEAESLYVKILETNRIVSDREGGKTTSAMNNLARVYLMQGRYNEAEQQYDRALELARRTWGSEHPSTLANMSVLATIYASQGRYGEAEQLYGKTLEALSRVVGEEHEYTVGCINRYARLRTMQEHYGQAEDMFNKALGIARRNLSEVHPHTFSSVNGLGVVHTKLKHYHEAETFLSEALKSRQRQLGGDHPDTLETINDFGVLRREQKRYDEAESMFHQALDGRRIKLGDDHPATLESMHELAALYKEQSRYAEAEPLLLEAAEGRRLKLGNTHPHTIESWNNLIALYEAWNKPEKANQWRAKLPLEQPKEQ